MNLIIHINYEHPYVYNFLNEEFQPLYKKIKSYYKVPTKFINKIYIKFFLEKVFLQNNMGNQILHLSIFILLSHITLIYKIIC